MNDENLLRKNELLKESTNALLAVRKMDRQIAQALAEAGQGHILEKKAEHEKRIAQIDYELEHL